MNILNLPLDIILILILFLDKPTLFALRFVNRFLMLHVNHLLFKNAFEYFKIHKLIFIYAYTIPFDVIVNECPYLRFIAFNLCDADFKDDKYSPDPKNQTRIFEDNNFYLTSGIKPIRLLQRMDLLDFKKLSQNIFASINQINKDYRSFIDIDFMEIMKYLLNQCGSLKTIDISTNGEEIDFNIDERLLIYLKEKIDKVNLFNYWYNLPNVVNFIKNIKKVINTFH